MDTSTRHHFWERIQQLKEKGTTVLFTTHYTEEVNYCADRVLLLDNGNLMADEIPYRLRMLNHEKNYCSRTPQESAIDLIGVPLSTNVLRSFTSLFLH